MWSGICANVREILILRDDNLAMSLSICPHLIVRMTTQFDIAHILDDVSSRYETRSERPWHVFIHEKSPGSARGG